MENLDKNQINKNLINIIKGSSISIIITLILLFVFSVILTYTTIQESIITPVVIVITIISILIGSSISSLKIKKNGLINGGLVGLIYILVIYILSSVTLVGFNVNMTTIIMICSSIVAGIIGGIIGVNL